MSTLVVRMECRPDARAEVVRHLHEDVVVWAQEQPGFVAGSWHVTDDGRWGLGFVRFGTSEAAETAAEAPRGYHDPAVPFRIASVEVYDEIPAAPASGAS